MWKQWKDKFLNRLKNEEETEPETREREEPPRRVRFQQQEVKAKMMYRYPENKTQSPANPSESKQETKNEEMPPTRREKRKQKSTEPDKEKIVNEKHEKPDQRKKFREIDERVQSQERKIYKKDDAPSFQLTEIPSPIYGFKKRPERENDEDSEEQVREDEDQADIITEPDVNDSENSVEREESKIEQEPKDSASEKPALDHHENNKPDEKDKMNPLQEIMNENEIEEKENAEEIKSKRELRQERRRRRERTRKRIREQSGPYNVVMTPKDRLQLALSEKRKGNQPERAEEQEQRAEEVNESELKPVEVEEVKEIHLPLHLLNDPVPESNENDLWLKEQQRLLEETLNHFHVEAEVVNATQGPSVTRFEVQPQMGVKVSKIRNLSDDLKLNMSAKDIRIEAPIPGKNTVGIEVPNPKAQMVGLQEILETEDFKKSSSPLTIALGLTIEGKAKITNIEKMPHGLIAGATGSGKSVCINAIILSILYKASHEDVKFLMIDPKMVELAPYNGIPHLVSPVITDVKAATQSLKWAVNEMEDRYERFVEEGVRDIGRYNKKVKRAGRPQDKMPYIVIVIDELSDLMMMSPQDVENSISRIAQKARACGIHLLLATQRPSVDVITGLIKANIPTRIAFSVSSQVDSRTILDGSGAEKLLGKGDMLFIENGTGKSMRLQGPFVSDEEIERVTAFTRQIAEPEYLFVQEELLEQVQTEEDEDELLDEAIQYVLYQQSASTSMLQRHFKIGYNRAARLMDTMEIRGIISGQNGSKPRDVLITDITVEQK